MSSGTNTNSAQSGKILRRILRDGAKRKLVTRILSGRSFRPKFWRNDSLQRKESISALDLIEECPCGVDIFYRLIIRLISHMYKIIQQATLFFHGINDTPFHPCAWKLIRMIYFSTVPTWVTFTSPQTPKRSQVVSFTIIKSIRGDAKLKYVAGELR
jgi:hypothetical protein